MIWMDNYQTTITAQFLLHSLDISAAVGQVRHMRQLLVMITITVEIQTAIYLELGVTQQIKRLNGTIVPFPLLLMVNIDTKLISDE